MSPYTVELFTPERRAGFFELMHGVGRSHIDDAEFEWWFDRNPVGRRLISLGIDDGRVVGVAAMSFFRMLLDGEERPVAIPVHVATEAPYRRQGIFSELELNNEREAAADGSPITITFPNAASHRIFVGRLGWIDLPGRRVWARPLRAAGVARYLVRRPSPRGGLRSSSPEAHLYGDVRVEPLERFPPETDEVWRAAAPAYGNHVVRDAQFLNWRYADTPRTYRRFGAYRDGRLRAVAIVGHTVKQGVSSGFLADLVSTPDAHAERVALLRRAAAEVDADVLIALPPRAQRRSFLRAGFLPTNRKIRFVGKVLQPGERLDPDPRAWHFTLGDFDFF
ncbi:MAG TPA: GNAT family N-acetyltransferase [Gaiellaceae bacterium]|nr:GNAT family N-acetyltransferase [Gaiellaceae bacterium]